MSILNVKNVFKENVDVKVIYFDLVTWENSSCSCSYGQKHYLCFHIIKKYIGSSSSSSTSINDNDVLIEYSYASIKEFVVNCGFVENCFRLLFFKVLVSSVSASTNVCSLSGINCLFVAKSRLSCRDQ